MDMEITDEWKSVNSLLELVRLYSNLGHILKDDKGEIIGGDTLNAEQVREYLLNKVHPLLPDRFRKYSREIYDHISGYKKEELVAIDSEIGKEIFSLIVLLSDFLKDAWRRIYILEDRVLQVYPPQGLWEELDYKKLSHDAVEKLKKSVENFNRGDFKDAIAAAWEAGESLTEIFLSFPEDFLTQIKYEGIKFDEILSKKRDFGVRLPLIYSAIGNKSPDNLIKYILFLLHVVYWLRNPAMHSSINPNVPKWMDDHIKHKINCSEWTRISVFCALQAAKEIQKLKEIEEILKKKQ